MKNVSPATRRHSASDCPNGEAAAYRFADYKETVVDLIARVTRVSIETVAITRAMAEASDLG